MSCSIRGEKYGIFWTRKQNLLATPLYFAASINKLHETSSSAAADKPARRAASSTNGKILKQLRDHNHAPLVGDMSSCCQNWYSLLVQNFRFSGSSDMIEAPKILKWVTWPDHAPIRDSLSPVCCDLHIQPLHHICSLCDRQLRIIS